MKRKEEKRKFRMSYAELQYACTDKTQFMRRDIEEYKQFGISDVQLLDFEIQVQKLKDLPTDDEFLGFMVVLTKKKEEISEDLRSQVRKIMLRVALQYGADSGQYRSYGATNLSRVNDLKLLHTTTRVHRRAKADLNNLALYGLNSEDLNELLYTAKQFEKQLNKRSEAIAERDIATHNRLIMANQMYEKLSQLCRVGKTIWVSRNEAKYNDYLLTLSNHQAQIEYEEPEDENDTGPDEQIWGMTDMNQTDPAA